jgi:hypothetical protein
MTAGTNNPGDSGASKNYMSNIGNQKSPVWFTRRSNKSNQIRKILLDLPSFGEKGISQDINHYQKVEYINFEPDIIMCP